MASDPLFILHLLLRKSRGVLAVALCTIALCAACSSDRDARPAVSGEVAALRKLSPLQRRNFENWRIASTKSCDPVDAFGLNIHTHERDRNELFIDGEALIQANGQSAVSTLR